MAFAGNWPTQIEYQDALQNPASCFADRELQTARPAVWTPFGLAQPVAGQFANVYRLRLADGTQTAVRFFLRPGDFRAERYAAFAHHLAALPAPLPCVVPFDYQEKGVRVVVGGGGGGHAFPLLRMDWVGGIPLNDWVRLNLNTPDNIARVADNWRTLVLSMEAARIAHGDYHHGNIIIHPESLALRLVDYDNVWVPALAGRASRSEAGHPSYQSPRQLMGDYGPFLDRFPALVIYAALRILAVAPDLWFRFDSGDNLLFQKTDFSDPNDARIFATLRTALARSREISRVVAALREACDAPAASQVPSLDRL